MVFVPITGDPDYIDTCITKGIVHKEVTAFSITFEVGSIVNLNDKLNLPLKVNDCEVDVL
ncbi:MAG: hypothetical protein AAGF33_00330 [Pseudomonadota bacterium]